MEGFSRDQIWFPPGNIPYLSTALGIRSILWFQVQSIWFPIVLRAAASAEQCLHFPWQVPRTGSAVTGGSSGHSASLLRAPHLCRKGSSSPSLLQCLISNSNIFIQTPQEKSVLTNLKSEPLGYCEHHPLHLNSHQYFNM